MENITHEEEYKGFTIKVMPDELNESPREWDNLGTMICWHSRYNLGDNHKYADYEEFLSENNVSDLLMLPLYLYDHSGITMYTTGNTDYHQHAQWDTSTVGFIYVTKEQIRKEFSVKRITKQMLKKAEDILRAEIKTYDQFLRGDVYGYMVEGIDMQESCWGFYGLDECIESAKEAIDYQVAELAKETPRQKAIRDQKKVEDFLTTQGFKPVDEFEENRTMFTKYEKEGIGVRIEQNL